MIEKKYIVVEVMGCELPIVFPEIIDHKTIAGNMKVLSAGFFSINDDNVSIFGKSVSLKLTPRKVDKTIIKNFLASQNNIGAKQ